MDEIFTAERPLKVWRAEILGTKENPGSFKSLAEAVNSWQRGIVSLLSAAEDGRRAMEPKGLQQLTDMLATVCDVGPASINPTPLLKCYDVVAKARSRRGEIDGKALERAFERSLPILGRMLRAWLAVSGEDEPEAGLGLAPVGPLQIGTIAPTKRSREVTAQEVCDALGEKKAKPSDWIKTSGIRYELLPNRKYIVDTDMVPRLKTP